MSKKYLFILATILLIGTLIIACESLDNQNEDTNNDMLVSNENVKNNKNTKEKDEITEDEALQKFKNHVEEHENYNPKDYNLRIEEKDEKFEVSISPDMPDDDQRRAQIIGNFAVDKATGEIKKLDDITSEKIDENKKVSEIVDMDQDEQRAHHEELAVKPNHVNEEVYEHLLLPGVHENTRVYEGRINPSEKVRFEFPDAKKIGDRSTFDPEISEDGYFTIKMNRYEFKEGQNIRIYITNGYSHEQTFDLPVHEVKEGMEEIRVKK